jgi:hypothetical protein
VFIVLGTKLYIKHIGPAKESVIYVVFNLENNSNANPIVDTSGKINLNSLISDELERGVKSKFSLSNLVVYKYSLGAESIFSSGTHVFEVPGKILVDELGNILSLPTLPELFTSGQRIRLTNSSFATDDIVCDTGEVSKTAAQEYSTKVAGTIGLNIGIGLMVILALVAISIGLHKKAGLSFAPDAGLFGGWDSKINIGYGFLIGVFFIISFSCFMAYGVRMGKDGNKTNIVTGELTSAILFLVLPVVMLWLKGNVLITKNDTV